MSEFFTSTGSFLTDCVVMALVMIFVENMIFTRALGTSTALVIIRKKNNLLVFGLILTLITVVYAAGFGGPAERELLPPAHLCSGYQSGVPAGAGDLWLPAGAVAGKG